MHSNSKKAYLVYTEAEIPSDQSTVNSQQSTVTLKLESFPAMNSAQLQKLLQTAKS